MAAPRYGGQSLGRVSRPNGLKREARRSWEGQLSDWMILDEIWQYCSLQIYMHQLTESDF